MTIYETVASKLSPEELQTLWVEADENPNFAEYMIRAITERNHDLARIMTADGYIIMTPAGPIKGTMKDGVFHADESVWAGGPPPLVAEALDKAKDKRIVQQAQLLASYMKSAEETARREKAFLQYIEWLNNRIVELVTKEAGK